MDSVKYDGCSLLVLLLLKVLQKIDNYLGINSNSSVCPNPMIILVITYVLLMLMLVLNNPDALMFVIGVMVLIYRH